MEAQRLEELPPMSTLSERQVRGSACVRCGIDLDNGNAVDLGAQHAQVAGSVLSWFPRACPQHGAAA